MSNEKISLYSLNDLKNTSDDAIPAYLNSIKFRQSHTLSDVRLALGYVAITISAATFLWDYKFGFESTKIYTSIAVVIYTILNGILTYWMTFVEKEIIYIGTNPQGDTIEISSKTDKHVPVYNLHIAISLKSNHHQNREIQTLKKPFNGWFNKAGYLVPLNFQQMLASNIPLIGAADPARVVSAIVEKNVKSESSEYTDNKQSISLSESSGVDVNQVSNTRSSRSSKKKGVKA